MTGCTPITWSKLPKPAVAHEVIFAPEAEEDLVSLFDYIFLNASPDRAFAYVERIRSYCLALSTFSERGSRREDLRPGLRIIGFERRVTIAFHVTASRVVVDRVLYSGRNVTAIPKANALYEDVCSHAPANHIVTIFAAKNPCVPRALAS